MKVHVDQPRHDQKLFAFDDGVETFRQDFLRHLVDKPAPDRHIPDVFDSVLRVDEQPAAQNHPSAAKAARLLYLSAFDPGDAVSQIL